MLRSSFLRFQKLVLLFILVCKVAITLHFPVIGVPGPVTDKYEAPPEVLSAWRRCIFVFLSFLTFVVINLEGDTFCSIFMARELAHQFHLQGSGLNCSSP